MTLFLIGLCLVAVAGVLGTMGSDAYQPWNMWDAASQVLFYLGGVILFAALLTIVWKWLP
jgi:hypothetical protein